MKEKVVKVSVVMPVLNGMPYFEKTLKSVSHQTLQELEVLIVDAGSTDGTVEYVREMQDRDARIRLLHSEKKSSGYQRNLGIREARGEYIGFCDADDYLESTMFEELYAAAEAMGKPDTVKSDYYRFITGEDGEEFTLYHNIVPHNKEKLYGKVISLKEYPMLYLGDGKMWSGIFRKDFLLEKKIRLNETPGASFSDFCFTGQVNMLADRQIYLKKAFYHYRQDNESSSVYKKDAMYYVLFECRSIIQFLEEHPKEKDIFFPYVMEKILAFIKNMYMRDMRSDETSDYGKEMEHFIEYLQGILQKSTDGQKSQLWRLHDLTYLMNARESFLDSVREKYKAKKADIQHFYDYMAGKKEIIIFGAGEMGKALLVFLTANEYKGNIVFCDNDQKMQNMVIMGCPIMSVEQAAGQYPDAVYCIPNVEYYTEMRKQLLDLKIPINQVIASPMISANMSVRLEYVINKNKTI